MQAHARSAARNAYYLKGAIATTLEPGGCGLGYVFLFDAAIAIISFLFTTYNRIIKRIDFKPIVQNIGRTCPQELLDEG
jgi:hypothetical protein